MQLNVTRHIFSFHEMYRFMARGAIGGCLRSENEGKEGTTWPSKQDTYAESFGVWGVKERLIGLGGVSELACGYFAVAGPQTCGFYTPEVRKMKD